MMNVNQYTKTFSISIQNSLAYKMNFIAHVLSGFIPFFVQVFIWISVYGLHSNISLNGYTLSELILYLGISMIITKIIQTNSHYEIASEIKNGNFCQFLVKPINYTFYWICKESGNKFIYSVFLLIVLFCFIFFMKVSLSIPVFLLGILAYILGFLVFFFVNYVLSLLSFWFVEVAQIFSATGLIITFLSGAVIPLSFFPNFLQNILSYLPFSLIIYFPVNIFCGKLDLETITFYLLLQCLWIVLLMLLSKILLKFGIKKYSAFGG